ncbi:MAG: MbnP family protein [Chitinophagaceae bacterium]|nr:MbnP family protein [Chitinophagaceae bacterium]
MIIPRFLYFVSMHIGNSIKLAVLAVSTLSFSHCQKESESGQATAKVNIEIIHKAGNQNFALNTSYTNTAGESFTVSTYKYYISHLELSGGKKAIGETYFLVDESDPASKSFQAVVETGNFNSISFLLGVDSLHNVSGAQTGALDPLKGMFWTWNSGYIMAKMEGNSPVSTLPANFFEYHIGGFKGATNTVKRITLPFPQTIDLKKGENLTIQISGDILQWFTQPLDFSIAAKPSITTPGANAKMMADNYEDMFSLVSVTSN